MRTEKTNSFPPPFTGEMVRRTGVGIAAFLVSAMLVTTGAFAGWREEASAADQARFAKLDEARAKAIGEAGRGASPHDLAVIDSVLHAQVVPANAAALKGDWRCRTIKLGGMTSHVIYGWFRCRIAEKDGALTLAKLTGSQRTAGTLYPQADAFVYLGASSAGSEKPHRYSGTGATAGAAATPDDQIGLFTALADGRARLELPYPVQESTFDVLELKR
jgi:hypothetical protein